MDPQAQTQLVEQPVSSEMGNEVSSQFTSVPVSPPQVGSDPTQVEGGMSQEMMRANLEALMNKIQERYTDIKSQRSASAETLMEQKSIALQEIFDLFQSMGIDPNSVEEVREFLDSIKKSDPELSQKIETALESLLEEDDGEVNQNPGVPPEDMNIQQDETIQQNI